MHISELTSDRFITTGYQKRFISETIYYGRGGGGGEEEDDNVNQPAERICFGTTC